MQKRVVLYNIRSAHNVGSIFRTSDGAGVETVYLVGATPQPIDRFGRTQNEIAKTSLGASAEVPWETVGSAQSESLDETLALLAQLKNNGFTIVAVEQSAVSVPLASFVQSEKVVYIFGREVEGVPQEIIDASDVVVEIPMRGMKESLNVSVAAGVVLFADVSGGGW